MLSKLFILLLFFCFNVYSANIEAIEEEVQISDTDNDNNQEKSTSESPETLSNITIIPLLGGSSEKGFSFGAAIYAIDLLSSKDTFMVAGAISTEGDSYLNISTWNNKFINKLFSYKLGVGYSYSGNTRYYGIDLLEENRESNLTLKKFNSDLIFGLNISKKINIGFGLLIDKINTSEGRNLFEINETYATYPDETNNYRSSFSLARRIYARYDSRNNAIFPFKGAKLEVDLDRSDGTLNSDFIFTRVITEGLLFLPIFKGLTIGNRAIWTSIIGDDLPYYALTSIGGADLLRAYGPYRFVAKHAVVIGSELRFQFFKTTKKRWYKYFEAALFADTGNISNQINKLSLEKQQYSVGAGIRVNISPGAILRFDYATNGKAHYFYLQQGYPF